jgi:hypothetical protein
VNGWLARTRWRLAIAGAVTRSPTSTTWQRSRTWIGSSHALIVLAYANGQAALVDSLFGDITRASSGCYSLVFDRSG